jgi:hypothetical protein
MLSYANETDGELIEVNGREIVARGWNVKGTILVDLHEIAASLGFKVTTIPNDGRIRLERMATGEDTKEEVIPLVEEPPATNEVETEVPHELQRPVKGPIRRLINDPEAPKGCWAPPLLVPPSSPNSEAYRRDEPKEQPHAYEEPFCDRCKGTPCICEPH